MRLKLHSLLALLALLLINTAAAAPYKPLPPELQWNIYLDLDATGGFAFMPVINAATMEPYQFALAANHDGDPGPVPSTGMSGDFVRDAMATYAGVAGSGAFPFLIFLQPVAVDLEDANAAYMPAYLPGPETIWGEAPPWDAENPPGADVGWFPVDPLPEDPVITDVQNMQTMVAQASRTPILVLDARLESSVPEPLTAPMAGLGLAILLSVSRLRRRT